ncbi:hypothetical protein F2Q70_00009696 [Brassica cretica]|uniref:Pectinesterase inhibitor domain-containing protein n=1 Tax=Brassica cretica TaxID=69181 RepID=A0A8S9M9E8_BRACR|nr:hypothetical protein F2Q70_00009696 [Brassica cretica]
MALDEDKKQKCLVAGSVSALLVIMVVSVAVITSKNSPNDNQIRQTTKAVKAVCAPTDYKDICLKSIMDASPNSTEPLELIKLAMNVTIESINQGLKKASIDVKPKTDEDPEAKDAFELCEKLMFDAIDDLKKCVNRGFSATQIVGFVEDLRVWLSGAIAFQQTCIDSFKEIKSNTLMIDMRKIFKPSKRLTSNSLAMVTELSTILPNSNVTGLTKALSKYARKLLSTEDGIPTWVRPEVRRLMEEEAPIIELEPQPPPPPPPAKTDAVVAQDGSGQFKTIAEALNFVPKDNSPFIIYIKTGIYKEQVKITKKMPYVTMIGDGQNLTIITGSLNFGIGRVKTFLTATVTLPFFKWRKWPISTSVAVNEDCRVRNFRAVTGSMSMSSPVYSTESRTGSYIPYRATTSRPSSGPIAGTLTPARKGDVAVPYLSLREHNMEKQQRISISSSPIYLVT